MLAFVGAEGLNGPPRWDNLLSSSATDFRVRQDDRNRHITEATYTGNLTLPPFGTLKSWMGSAHFLTKTLEKVRTEMSLHVLAYNIKRLIQMFGVRPLLDAIRA